MTNLYNLLNKKKISDKHNLSLIHSFNYNLLFYEVGGF